jgi:hypothetical protein
VESDEDEKESEEDRSWCVPDAAQIVYEDEHGADTHEPPAALAALGDSDSQDSQGNDDGDDSDGGAVLTFS